MARMKTSFEKKPIWGLPGRLIEKDGGGQVTIIAMMQRYGLNREQKRVFASKLKHDVITLPQMSGLNDSDRKILSIYISPYHRFRGFWEALHELKDSKTGSPIRKIFLAPDYALLDSYSLNFLKQNFNEKALIQDCPVWPEIAENISHQLRETTGTGADIHMCPDVFMIWLQIVDDLSKWNSLDSGKRALLANAVFALSSISLSEWFIRDAMRRCTNLIDEFEPLLRTDGQINRNDDYPDQDDVEKNSGSSRTTVDSEDCKAKWEECWEILSDRLVDLSIRIKATPAPSAVNELGEVYEEFQKLAPFLLSSTNVLVEQFKTRFDHLLETLRSLQETAYFNWINGLVLEQIRARWEIAHSHIETSDGLRELTRDFSRAEEEGKRSLSCYQAEFEKLVVTRGEVEQTDQELASLISSIQRRALQHKRTEHKKEEIRLSLPCIRSRLKYFRPIRPVVRFSTIQ